MSFPPCASGAIVAEPRDAGQRTITALDLFAGAGGLTEGFRTAGQGRLLTVRAIEFDKAAAATFALNHGGRVRSDEVIGGNVYAGKIEDWLANENVPEVDVVIGGPPCQGFSTLNRGKVGTERNELWRTYAETVHRASPQYFVLENVPAFLKSPQFGVFTEALKGGILKDYDADYAVLNAADYGAAQARKRIIVIGHHKDIPNPGLPWPEFAGAHRTLAEVLDGVPSSVIGVGLPEGSVSFEGRTMQGPFTTTELHFGRSYTELSKQRFAAIPPRGNRFDLPEELKTPGWRKHHSGSGDVMGRLYWDKPSVTIRTEFFKPEKGRYLHPTEHRAISHYEAALIQGFPETYRWIGSREEIARQIGNAVPIPLGAAIGRHLIAIIDDAANTTARTRTSEV